MDTQTFNVQEASANLPSLLQAVISGKDVIIADKGKPLARLSRVEGSRPIIHFGVLKGKIRVSDDFDPPLPDSILSEFESNPCGY